MTGDGLQPVGESKENMATTPLEFPAEIDFVHFVSHYAHDLRSPFNRVMGFLKIVLKGQDGPLTDLQKEDLNTVYLNSVYAFTQVSNLIDISRLVAGEKSLNLAETDLASLFQQAVTQWKRYHGEANPGVQIEIHLPTVLAPIQVDGALLSQAIAGLISVVVERVKPPSQVSLTADDSPGGIVFSVRSIGQPAPNPSRLDSDSYGYISQTLITYHDGKFTRQEAGDGGAVIEFVLPKK
jgi:signal transduction histidine kinase